MITSLARWCFRNPWLVIVGGLFALIAVLGAVMSVGAAYDATFEIPDSESRRGFDTLDEHFGGFGSGQSGSIVFRAADGIDAPAVRGAMEGMFTEVATFDGVTLSSPYEGVGAATQVSADSPSPSPRSACRRTSTSRRRRSSASRWSPSRLRSTGCRSRSAAPR